MPQKPLTAILSFKTKDYLKQFFENKYGSPLMFEGNIFFEQVLQALIRNPLDFQRKHQDLVKRVDTFKSTIDILVVNSRTIDLCTELNERQTITLNKFFESLFDDCFIDFCQIHQILGLKIHEIINEFCTVYFTKDGCEITYQALEKKWYRHRKSKANFTSQLFEQSIAQIIEPSPH